MYKILKAGKLAGNIYEMVVEAPRVAKHCLPGQFIIVKMDEVGGRIPLTMTEKPVQLLLYSSRSELPQRNLPH